MFSFLQIRHLTVAVVAILLMAPSSVNAATKTSKSKSKSSKSSKSTKAKTSSKTASAKVPPKKIDVSKLETVESLYHKESASLPAPKRQSFFGLLSSSYSYDSRMLRAAEIASARAYAHSQGSCWRYVKDALVSAAVIDSRPKTAYAKEAAWELTSDFGFSRVLCNDPFKAPIGSVLVYGGRGAGHIEFRTQNGFVSDFWNAKPSSRPLIGVYVKR